MCGIPNIDIRYLINGVSLLKVRIKVPFFAYPHFTDCKLSRDRLIELLGVTQ